MPPSPMPFSAIQELLGGGAPSILAAPAGGYGALQVAHAVYDFATDGGAVGLITPKLTASIPDDAILVGGIINSVAAVTSGGAATVAVGTSAGSSATALLAATAKATLALDAVLPAVPTNAAPVKLTAAGNITLTVATAALTAGKIEIFVFYVVANG